MKNIKPFYDHKFRQWCISYTPKGGGYAAVWADTEEDCIKSYNNITKTQKGEIDMTNYERDMYYLQNAPEDANLNSCNLIPDRKDYDEHGNKIGTNYTSDGTRIMTQGDKELLLKDLCAREPYHPSIQVFNDGYEGFQDGEFDTNLWFYHIDAFRFDRIEILPFLRPMSSMTEEELKEFRACHCVYDLHPDFQPMMCNITNEQNMFDWLNAHHFDYRGLIEKGLAIELPEDMYKID